MVKKVGALLIFTFLMSSCGPEGTGIKKEEVKRVCSDDTVLAQGRGLKVTLSDFKYTWGLLNPKAKEYFKEHPQELLKRMVNRRLVLSYIKDSGLSKTYGLDKEMEEFKKEYLARKFVSDLARKRVKPVTEEDIEKRFKELFPNKDPKKMTEGDKEFIRNELKVKAFDEAVSSVYSEVEKKLNVVKSGNRILIKCCGLEVSEEVKKGEKAQLDKLKERFFTEYFYRQAVKEGYDKDPQFERMFTEYFAGKAIELFRRELSKGIEVKPEEIEEFYKKNKEKFKMPPRVRAVVFYFSDEKRAKEALKLLKEGKPWKDVAKRFGQFNVKERTYYKDPKDPIGVSAFSLGRKGEPIVIAISKDKFAVIYPIKFIPENYIPLEKAKKFIALKLKEKKLREKEEEKLRELWKEYRVKLKNLECLKGAP